MTKAEIALYTMWLPLSLFAIICVCADGDIVTMEWNNHGVTTFHVVDGFISLVIPLMVLMFIGLICIILKKEEVNVTVTPVQQQVVKQPEKPKLVGAPSPFELLSRNKKQPKIVKFRRNA